PQSILGERGGELLSRWRPTRDARGDRWNVEHRAEKLASLLLAEAREPSPDEPLGHRICDRKVRLELRGIGQDRPREARETATDRKHVEPIALLLRRAAALPDDVARELVKDGVDESDLATRGALRGLQRLDGLIDRGVRGNLVEVDELVRAHAERLANRRTLARHAGPHVRREDVIERVPVAHDSEDDLLEKPPIANVELVSPEREDLVDETI